MPAASVILPISDWGSLARQCLRAVFATLPQDLGVEVLVVTDTAAMTARMLVGFGERLRLVHTDRSSSFAAACNAGAEAATSDHLVFLHHDTEPRPGWLAALLREARSHPEASLIGSRLLALNDTIDQAGILIAQDGSSVARYRGFPADHPAVSTPCLVAAVDTAGMLARRDRFAKVAGFDTAFATAFHDIDLCLRLGELGDETWYCPASTLYHYAAADPPSEDAARDLALYRSRWGHRARPDDVRHYLDDGLLAFTYRSSYPIQIDVSPALGVPDAAHSERETVRLLDLRSRQVASLLDELTRQTIARGDATLRQFQSPIDTIATTKLQALLASRRELVFPSVAHPRVSVVIPIYNQAHYLYLTLENLRATPTDVPYEVILIDDGSVDATSRVLDCLGNVRVHAHAENRGFGAACNSGVALACGEFVCFLNSDVVPMPGWLDALVEVMDCHPECGAVGAKLVSADGMLQEAGSILWADGSALAYGRGKNPDAAEYTYAREVDYCSAACLLVRRKHFDAVGGFDPRYAPAYYEDVDLCLGLWRAGSTVRYAPQAVALHLEHASHGRGRAVALQVRNRGVLIEKWPDLARDHGALGADIVRWRDRRRGERVLLVDDLVPFARIGSGFPRTAALLDALVAAGYVISYLPTTDPTPREPMTGTLQRQGVEVLHGALDPHAHIEAHRGCYAVAIVSRPHNAPLIDVIRAANPGVAIIYDAEALFAVRASLHERLRGVASSPRALAARIRDELAYVASVDCAMTVSEMERRAIALYHPQVPSFVWGHAISARIPAADFAARQGLLFVGPLSMGPNHDAVLRLIGEIFPQVRDAINCRLTIVGAAASDTVREAANLAGDAMLAGFVEDLAPVYDAYRVFVAPHQFAAGIPLKVVEAMANGVPCVVSPLLGQQLGITDGVEALIATDATDFAARIVRIHEDAALWRRVQANAFRFVREHYDPVAMRDTLRTQIDALLARRGRAGERFDGPGSPAPK